MRSAIEQRLLSLAKYSDETSSEMTILDYQLETSRLSALIYTKCALCPFLSSTSNNITLCNLKNQLISRLKQSEEATARVGGRLPPGSVAWALFICGILSLRENEKLWFVWQIAKSSREAGIRDWREMEARHRKIAWQDGLSVGICKSL